MSYNPLSEYTVDQLAVEMRRRAESANTGPTPHVRFSYTFADLSEDAKLKALETIAGKLSGDWFDDGNREDIAATIVMSLAVDIAFPGHEKYGEGDFPGIDGVKLESWDADRAEAGFHGTLTRENAPGLDWPEDVYALDLDARRYGGTTITVELEEDVEETADVTAVADAFKQTVREKIQGAATAGQRQAEYIGSEENAQEHIDGNDPEFTEDGDLF